MRYLNFALQTMFYVFILAVFLGQAASAGYSHDENQFIAGGQLLADHGLLPYRDFTYTHMPYAVALYAVSAKLTNYDFLAGRILNALAWFLSTVLIVRAFRHRTTGRDTRAVLLWEFLVAYVFLTNPILGHVVGNALNHSLATLFSLAALALFVRAVRSGPSCQWAAASAGACASVAGLIRFNFVSVVVVLGVFLSLHGWIGTTPRTLRRAAVYAAGVVAAALPVLGLFTASPSRFLYGNLVYVRLNTIYYQELHYEVNMQLGQKLMDFLGYLMATPIDLVLYLVLAYVLIRSILSYFWTRSPSDLTMLALSTTALALAASAFVPSPTQPQYFLAPIPLLCVLLFTTGREIGEKSLAAFAYVGVSMLALLYVSTDWRAPVPSITALNDPSHWTPMQSHEFSQNLRQSVPSGRILTLLPMFPLEAGFDAYPFAANGPFSWRTSLLLTSARRLQYGITSPDELPELLTHFPPAAILTGFESTNAGFERNDLGGLEAPLVDYAQQNGYEPVPLPAPFLEQKITLWTRGP